MFHNKLKSALRSGQSIRNLSLFVGFPSIHVVEMAALNGFDTVVLDNEHGMLSDGNVEHLTIAAENSDITPVVRVPSSDPICIMKAMDRGAHGVHVPQVETRMQAEGVVEAVKYPPVGRRGAAFSMRAAKYGTVPVHEYLQHANSQSWVAVHIESGKALENVEEILQVEGIDLVYIGPTDLSVSLGLGGQTDHPDMIHAAEVIRDTAHRHGVQVGIHVKDAQGAAARFNWGASYVGLTVTSLINQVFGQYTREARGEQK